MNVKNCGAVIWKQDVRWAVALRLLLGMLQRHLRMNCVMRLEIV